MDRSKWEYKKIKDVCTSIDDGDWIESQDQSSEGIRLIQTGNVGIGEYLDKADKSKFISEETFEKLNCKEIFAGDCLISRLPDPIGRACILPSMSSRMITAVDCSILRFKDFISPQFFVHYTKSRGYNSDINKYATGATRKRISRKNLEGIIIPIPSIEDQQRIVAELDCLNEMIALKQEQLKEFDKLAQSIFYDMFGDPVLNEKKWKVYTLSSICDVRDGTHDSPQYVEEGYPLITSKNVIGGGISFDNVNYISKADLDSINARSRVDDGDIIMPMIGTIGNPVIVHKDREFAIKNVALIKFDSSTNVLNLYIQRLLDCESYSNYIMGLNRGGTQKFIALKTIRNLPIPLPPLSLQQQFAEKITAIEAQKELVKQSIAETQALLDYSMDYYFNE